MFYICLVVFQHLWKILRSVSWVDGSQLNGSLYGGTSSPSAPNVLCWWTKRWMEEILQQLVDGPNCKSHDLDSVSPLPIVVFQLVMGVPQEWMVYERKSLSKMDDD